MEKKISFILFFGWWDSKEHVTVY